MLALALAGLAGPATAGGPDSGDYGPLPPIGSRDVSIADPLVSRPSTTPCEVTLFDDLSFDDFNPRAFDYAPPAACAGPWARVVLTGDFSVTAGVQFDRTSLIWIGGVNVFFGTTVEPSGALAPDWHVERDLTDYSALLAGPAEGRVLIGNLVNAMYTGVIHGTAKLEFYPVPEGDAAPPVPDRVLALGADPLGMLLHQPAGRLGLALGTALDLAGLLWTDRLVAALRPEEGVRTSFRWVSS